MSHSEVIGIAAFILTCIASVWKVYDIIGTLERKLILANHENEKLELTINGIRERMEHIQTRISTRQREQEIEIDAIANWLAKNTSYERRDSPK